MVIGFSSGALARGDFGKALTVLHGRGTSAIELSALRPPEFFPLLDQLPDLQLSEFQHVALHAPGKFIGIDEREVARRLERDVPHDWNIVVHPDTLTEYDVWRTLGDRLCIENMDKRKRTGRTIRELIDCFERLPESSFCLDLAHTRQVDPTMSQAVELLDALGPRLRQLHISDLDSAGRHMPLSTAAIFAFQDIAPFIPAEIPVIIESVIEPQASAIERELDAARRALCGSRRGCLMAGA